MGKLDTSTRVPFVQGLLDASNNNNMPRTFLKQPTLAPLPDQDSESGSSEDRIDCTELPFQDYSYEVSHSPPIRVFEHDYTFKSRLTDSYVSGQTVADLQKAYHRELSVPVGCRLAHFWPRWVALGASSYHVAKIRFGITLHWINEAPPLSNFPLIWSDTKSIFHSDLIQDAIDTMIDKKAIIQISNKSLGFYSRIFMIPKKGSNKWRPVIDLSALNKFIVIPKFKMETAEIIRASLQENEWVTSIDLQDAYFHAPCTHIFANTFVSLLTTKFTNFKQTLLG